MLYSTIKQLRDLAWEVVVKVPQTGVEGVLKPRYYDSSDDTVLIEPRERDNDEITDKIVSSGLTCRLTPYYKVNIAHVEPVSINTFGDKLTEHMLDFIHHHLANCTIK
jgi:hypothetical protein